MDNSVTMKYIDIFAGCGGLSLGLHNSGWKGVFAIEKSPDAFKTLEYNLISQRKHFDWPSWLPQTNHDINELLLDYKEELRNLRGQIDLVAGGPPCQGFSMAGRRNEQDTRNNLVNSYIEFIKLVKPKLILFENVKGFTMEFKKNKDKGIAYSTYVTEKLRKCGYQIQGRLVNFADYGIPQKRTRFILIGIRKDIAYKDKDNNLAESFFIKLEENKYNFLDSKNISVNTTLKDAISDLFKKNGTIESPDSKRFQAGIYSKCMSNYQKLMRTNATEKSPDSHRFAKHCVEIENKFTHILSYSRRNKDLNKEIREQFNIKKHTIIPLDENAKSPTITTLPDDYIHYLEPRILTVREYARIQSFPDDFEFKGKYTTGGKRRVLEVPRYSQIGNAIPPLFGEQSGIILYNILNG